MNYDEQAARFLEDTETEFYAERGHKSPGWAGEGIPVYGGPQGLRVTHGRHWCITLVTPRGRFSFDWWESIDRFVKTAGRDWLGKSPKYERGAYWVGDWHPERNSNPPTPYDVLACLTAYCPLDFAEFCADFGYSTDSIKARDAWQECMRQRAALERMYTPEQLEALAEIN